MRSPIISLVALTAILLSPLTALAATGSSMTTTGSMNPSMTTDLLPLRMSGSIIVSEVRTLQISFNQPIQIESLRVQITDLATSETLKVDSVTGTTTTSPMMAIIHTATDMTPGASYKLTIRTAFAENGTTIAAGTDSIKEFSAPLDLIPLAAAPNPSAVIALTGAMPPATTPSAPMILQPSHPTVAATGSTTKVPEALPVTGVETTLIVILAALAASGLLIFRKKN